jgi:hypothetical protein
MTLMPFSAIAVLVAAIAGMFFGMDIQEDRNRAQLLVQERAMHAAYVNKVGEYRAHAQHVSKELNDETTKRQTDAVAFRAELARAKAGAVQLAVCNPAGTGVRLTGDFVGLFDRALDIGMPRAGDPARADAPATRPDPVEPADVLANVADNAEAWGECRSSLRGWQTLARRYGWVK